MYVVEKNGFELILKFKLSFITSRCSMGTKGFFASELNWIYCFSCQTLTDSLFPFIRLAFEGRNNNFEKYMERNFEHNFRMLKGGHPQRTIIVFISVLQILDFVLAEFGVILKMKFEVRSHSKLIPYSAFALTLL